MREILDDYTKLTQGTIFSNAKSCIGVENVYGILINARCDIEHPQHYDNFLYLPIIQYIEWESHVVLKRILKKKYGDVVRILDGCADSFSYEALLYMPEHIDEIIDKCIRKESEREKIKKSLFFMGVYNRYKSCGKPLEADIKFLKSFLCNDFEAEKKKLLENNLSDAYYLENVDFQDQVKQCAAHWVVLVTEVHSIPSGTLSYLKDGIDLGREADLKKFFGSGELTIPCATLKSPFIEHLVKKVEALFRVGVDRADFFD